jgi:hypothetical protein
MPMVRLACRVKSAFRFWVKKFHCCFLFLIHVKVKPICGSYSFSFLLGGGQRKMTFPSMTISHNKLMIPCESIYQFTRLKNA